MHESNVFSFSTGKSDDGLLFGASGDNSIANEEGEARNGVLMDL